MQQEVRTYQDKKSAEERIEVDGWGGDPHSVTAARAPSQSLNHGDQWTGTLTMCQHERPRTDIHSEFKEILELCSILIGVIERELDGVKVVQLTKKNCPKGLATDRS
ncbi:hypothetical protein J6590_031966 [Homalodisca vitripennis]|nr:hypothetical protein J6590_031966 [Homalodisca vitripennis]